MGQRGWLRVQRLFAECIEKGIGVRIVQRGKDEAAIQNWRIAETSKEEDQFEEEVVIQKEGRIKEENGIPKKDWFFEKESRIQKEGRNQEEDGDEEEEFLKKEGCIEKEDGVEEEGRFKEEDRIKKEACFQEKDRQKVKRRDHGP